jgi:hypothetical protein
MSLAIFLAPVRSQNATTRCPTVCVIIEANEVLPVTDFVNPALMFKLVRKYPTAMRISQKPSRRSPKANQVLSVVRSGGLSI